MIISILLPTRGRINTLISSIRSLLDNLSSDNSIEVLLRFDDDDLYTVESVKRLIGNDERIRFCVGQKYGYKGLHRYTNELAASARGDWLILFSDDALMQTKDWDKEIEKYNGQMVFLDTAAQNMHFPIIPRKVFDILGHISLSTHCDTWICDIGDALKIRIPTSINILHNRADLTGSNRDATYDARQYQTNYRNLMDESLRANDTLLLKLKCDKMKIGMVGCGKLGLMVALTIESKGHDIVGYDTDPKIEEYLQKRKVPFTEEYVDELLANTKMRMVSLQELVDISDIIFIAVQTPRPLYEGTTGTKIDLDYSRLKELIKQVDSRVNNIKKDKIVVIISTVLPGTIDREIRPLIGPYLKLVYGPLFIAMGTIYQDYLNQDFVLIGTDNDWSTRKLEEFYKTINSAPVFKTDIRSAEAIKIFYNTFIEY